MKEHLTPLLFAMFTLLLIAANSFAIPTCTIRSGSCNAGETCIFSVYQQNNSHIGSCSYYSNLVCCTEITSATIRSGSCNAGEGRVFSLYATSNSHAAQGNYFTNIICAKFSSNPVVTNIRSTSCLSREGCLTSFYQARDTHVGVCGYFGNNVCIQQNYNTTVTVVLNNTSPNWNDSVLVSGIATRADGTNVDTTGNSPAAVNVNINSTLGCTANTNSTGGYNCTFAAPNSIGLYIANVTLNDTTTSQLWSNSTTFNILQAFGQTNATSATQKTVTCYEEPRIVQNPDGTLTVSTVRICVSK